MVLSALLLALIAAPVLAVIVAATFVLVLPAICSETYKYILDGLSPDETEEETKQNDEL